MPPDSFDELACLKAVPQGCELVVQVVPNASRSAMAGYHDGALRVRLAAPPIEGRANAALIKWLAEALGLPRRSIQLVSGDTNRRKRIRLACERSVVADWLRRQQAQDGAPGA